MNDYEYEVKFYLSIMLYDKYLKEDYVLLDSYMNTIDDIYLDYLPYDDEIKPLIENINYYIEIRKDFILENLNEVIEECV